MNCARRLSARIEPQLCRRRQPWRRKYATEHLPRPPPSEAPPPQTFSRPANPGPVYTRPALKRNLPPLERRWPGLLAFTAVGIAGWGIFYTVAANQEKLSSSVVRQILDNIRESPELRDVLGEVVRPEPKWYLSGHPWVAGSINNIQGHADVSFRVKGHKGAGTLYFTSIRKAKGEPFSVLRFRIIADDGTVVNLPT